MLHYNEAPAESDECGASSNSSIVMRSSSEERFFDSKFEVYNSEETEFIALDLACSSQQSLFSRHKRPFQSFENFEEELL